LDGTPARKSDKIRQNTLKNWLQAPIFNTKNRGARMDIAPIPGIRVMTPAQETEGPLRPPAIFEIDSSAKPGDGNERRNGRKAAGAEESDQEDLMLEGEPESVSKEEEGAPAKQIDYFA
jgi:hypothetical protein